MDENEEIKDEVVTTEDEDCDETTESGGIGVGGAVLGIGALALVGIGVKKLWNHFRHPKTKWIKVPVDEDGEVVDEEVVDDSEESK